VEPLRYVQIESDLGSMEAAFYYDVAPNTVANFLRLADGGFYNGLAFHRIVPGFVVQGGDPVGDGTGGPGYRIDAEFNDRPHLPGVMSMAREGDPIEQQGAPPRDRARNSAGSQFFIALDYETTRRLDGRYTAFGRVTDGMETVQAIARSEIADAESGQPVNPPRMTSVQVLPVTVELNPYPQLFEIGDADLQTPDTALDLDREPAGEPATQPDADDAADGGAEAS
ncbi:MAG: peptidylprolyl isomerase, partial [Planctomycetota bacterium]